MRRLLVLLGVVPFAAVAFIELRNRGLAERLIEDVHAASLMRLREVHRGPVLEGETFETCLAAFIDDAPDAGTFAYGLMDAGTQIRDLRDGVMPPGAVSADILADEKRLMPWAENVADCTRAPGHGDVPGLSPFASWKHPRNVRAQSARLTAPRVLLVSARLDVAQGDPASALRKCSDVLALARDAVAEVGLVGAMLAQVTTRMAMSPCGAAIDAADDASRAAFLSELRALRRTLPAFRDVLVLERLEMQLMVFGGLLWDGERQRLTENARALANDQRGEGGALRTLELWLYWSSYVERMDKLIAASSPPLNESAFSEIDGHHPYLEVLLSDGAGIGSFVHFAARYDCVGRGFDLLESAALVRSGSDGLPSVSVVYGQETLRLSAPWDDQPRAEIVLRRHRP